MQGNNHRGYYNHASSTWTNATKATTATTTAFATKTTTGLDYATCCWRHRRHQQCCHHWHYTTIGTSGILPLPPPVHYLFPFFVGSYITITTRVTATKRLQLQLQLQLRLQLQVQQQQRLQLQLWLPLPLGIPRPYPCLNFHYTKGELVLA